MSVSAPPTRVGTGSRRAGYVIAVLVNTGLLVGVNAWPGWDAVPFLTDETSLVLSAVNVSIAVNLVANVVYAVHDPWWLKSSGDIVTLGVGLVAVVRVWQVFPFDLGANPLDWAVVVRILLAVGIIGSALGMVVALVTLVRGVLKA